MRYFLTRPLAGLVLLAAAAVVGCGVGGPPPLTQVEGTVLLDNKPLPGAQVEFVPKLEKFGAEMNSTGLTDENGHYRLTCNFKQQPGAVVAKHWVLVTEAPVPEEYRRPDGDTQAKYSRYVAGLKNRPIPNEYATVGKTPLVLEVTADKQVYDLTLVRKK
jgi:hypothetical protein